MIEQSQIAIDHDGLRKYPGNSRGCTRGFTIIFPIHYTHLRKWALRNKVD
jgi:hypothetical protein